MIKFDEHYRELNKPLWSPPPRLFGQVWTILYILILISYGHIAYLSLQGRIPTVVVFPFILNLIFNALYTRIQFIDRKLTLALVDVILTLGTLVWLMVAIFPYVPWVAYINIPHLGWLIFATVLQTAIVVMNQKSADSRKS